MKALFEKTVNESTIKIVKERYGEIGVGIFTKGADGLIRNGIILDKDTAKEIARVLSES